MRIQVISFPSFFFPRAGRRLLGLQAQSVLTSVLKNDNLKPKNGKLKRDRERERNN